MLVILKLLSAFYLGECMYSHKVITYEELAQSFVTELKKFAVVK